MKKIMIVDDEPDTLELVDAVLSMNEFSVITFSVAQKGLDYLNKNIKY